MIDMAGPMPVLRRQAEQTMGYRSVSALASRATDRRYPFFLVVDDGGRPCLNESGARRAVTMANYELIRELAAEFECPIPIAYTLRYLDRENVAGLGGAISYADELIAFIREHRSASPIHHHGLTHGYEYPTGRADWPTSHAEFFDLDHGRSIPEQKQRWHLDQCARIIESLQLGPLTTFVPPCHAWEPGVTDRLLAEYGIEQLITVPRLRFAGKSYNRSRSDFVRVLPRKSLGISHHVTEGGLSQRTLGKAVAEVLPMNLPTRLRYYRRVTNPWMHSYYVHITNFFPATREFWQRFFDLVRARRDVVMPRTESEADQLYWEGVTP